MNKSQAIQKFWSSFGLPAYDQYTVPLSAQMPYITYSVSERDFGYPVALTASLWYRSQSWEEIELKSYEIAKAISSGQVYPIDGGYLWIYKGSPFAQRLADNADDTVRRIVLNISAEFLTAD